LLFTDVEPCYIRIWNLYINFNIPFEHHFVVRNSNSNVALDAETSLARENARKIPFSGKGGIVRLELEVVAVTRARPLLVLFTL